MHIDSATLIAAIRGEGLRVTRPRRVICEIIATAHGEHLTAQRIIEQATSKGARLEASTVYRTLDALEAAGIITHAHLGHGASVYHLADEPGHHHLVCSRCGSTQALPESDLASFIGEVEARTGFVADPTHFAMSGVCAACAESG